MISIRVPQWLANNYQDVLGQLMARLTSDDDDDDDFVSDGCHVNWKSSRTSAAATTMA